MKTLYLIRHAKSSWNFDLPDHDRPLGKRGRKDVVKMSEIVANELSKPELIISSTASRAFYTALFFADAWKYEEEKIVSTKKLFHCDANGFISALSEYNHNNSIAIFGHNPGLNELIELLAKKEFDNLPTCGVIALQSKAKDWKNIVSAKCEITYYAIPKEKF